MKSKHVCPDRCHLCPLLNGDIMPGCIGTAVLAREPRDRSYCTCSASNPSEDFKEEMRARMDALEHKLLAFLPHP